MGHSRTKLRARLLFGAMIVAAMMLSEVAGAQQETFSRTRRALVSLFASNACNNKDPVHNVWVTYTTLSVTGLVPFGKGDERDGQFVIDFHNVKVVENTWPSRGEVCSTWGDTVRLELKDRNPNRFLYLPLNSPDAAQKAVAYLDWLIAHADENAAAGSAMQEKFREDITAWRSAAVKPPMPEDARVHQVLAENAVREKNLDKAIGEYEAALQIFPTWPDGQNNLAFLCGETGDYDCAIEHAQDYLELAPNATDGQAVKDKIIIWKDKIGESQSSQASPAAQPTHVGKPSR